MKDINNYEGRYAITEDGQVWSYARKKFMSAFDNGHGYLCVGLIDASGKRKVHKVHRLVALAFVENPEGKPQVDHIDGCRTHNEASNLRWTTGKENCSYATQMGKPKCFSRVLCVETGEVYESGAAAGRATGIHPYGINNVLNGKQKTAGGYHWERYYEKEETSQSN